MKTTTHSTAPLPMHCYAEGVRQAGDDVLYSPDSPAKCEPTIGAPPARASLSDQPEQQCTSSDAYLVAECLKGNEAAWEAIINRYKRLIYSIPIKYGASSEDAADILQSVYMELFCELSKLRRAESLKSWLMVVASRKCFQWHREKRLELALDNVEGEYPEAVAVSAPEMIEAEKEQCLREGIAQLPPRCRELVHLLFYEQPPVPYAQISHRLGLPTGSIGFTRARCLERLHKVLVQIGFLE